ncbi:MAG: Phosphoglycolate phosphatase [Microgenomates bacterium OLB23]|nr:MAG: Phosphoglycolate phosphatase [Microgenomates bacterium OLB23]
MVKIESVVFDFGNTLYNPNTSSLFPYVPETLQTLLDEGLNLGLVTIAMTNDIERRERQLNELNLSQFFMAIEIVELRIGTKDFKSMLMCLNSEAQATVVVGDSIEHDIAPAHSLGARTILTLQGSSAPIQPTNQISLPDWVVYRIDEVPGIIRDLSTSENK